MNVFIAKIQDIPGKEGELPGDKLPGQMCPHCEIGQAVIKGFNAARDIGIQACDTLKEAKDERITELKAENTNKDSYIKRLKQQISRWEIKYDRLLEATHKHLKG